jgi:hypothetical protein
MRCMFHLKRYDTSNELHLIKCIEEEGTISNNVKIKKEDKKNLIESIHM